MGHKVEVIGHRGAAGHAPENTFASFNKALEIGVDRIEFDVHATKDGVPVVIHDETLERTTNGQGKVKEKLFSELKELDAGSWFSEAYRGEKVPALEEVMREYKDKISFNIEVKASGCEEEIVRLLKKYAPEGAVISSFHREILVCFRALYPEGRLQFITATPTSLKTVKEELGVEAINPFYLLVTAPFMEEAKKAGLKVNPWTVDEGRDIERLLELDVDGIVSNYPERVLALLKKKREVSREKEGRDV